MVAQYSKIGGNGKSTIDSRATKLPRPQLCLVFLPVLGSLFVFFVVRSVGVI